MKMERERKEDLNLGMDGGSPLSFLEGEKKNTQTNTFERVYVSFLSFLTYTDMETS